MKTSKAIELLEEWIKHPPGVVFSSELPAVKLGIEALRRCKTLAENNPLWAAKPLPGETIEKEVLK